MYNKVASNHNLAILPEMVVWPKTYLDVSKQLKLKTFCMVADVTETRNVIPSLEFKTWTTKKF